MAENIFFGNTTAKNNFNFGSNQVQKIDLGGTTVWINAIAATITPSVNDRENTSVTIRLTFTGNDPGVMEYGYYTGTTTAATKVVVATGQDVAAGGNISFTISGLAFNSTYEYLFYADNGSEGTALGTFQTNNYVIDNVNGGVGSGISIPGDVANYSATFPVAYGGSSGGGGTSVSGLTWTVAAVSTAASGSPSSGITGSPGNWSVNSAGNHSISWSGGSVSSIGTLSASISGSASFGLLGLTGWSSVGSFTNSTSQTATVGGGIQSFQADPGTSTSIGAYLSFGSSSGPNTAPAGNQSSFTGGNPHGVGTQSLAPGASCTIYLGVQTSTTSALSGGLTVFLDGNGVRQRNITGLTYSA